MASVATIPSASLATEFLTSKGKEVIRRMFLNFETANIVTKFEGVRDTLVLADLDVVKDILYEWTGTTTFTRTDDALSIADVRLKTSLIKAELRATFSEEKMRAFNAYLAGQGKTLDDMHFMDYLLEPSTEKMSEEVETAMWQAVEDTNPVNAGLRKIGARFHGYKKLAKAAGVASKATVVATGAITDLNAVDKINTFFRAAHKTMKKKGFTIFCSYTTFESYQINYAATHQGREVPLQEVKKADYSFSGIPLMLGGGKTFLVPIAGFGDDAGLIGTTPKFLAYGYDIEGEMGEWDVQKQGWETWMLNKFPIGVQILMQKTGFLIVNDQLPN